MIAFVTILTRPQRAKDRACETLPRAVLKRQYHEIYETSVETVVSIGTIKFDSPRLLPDRTRNT